MNASISRRPRRHTSSNSFTPETLESRTLLSAWSTMDNYQLVGGRTSQSTAMAADATGNVYAAGSAMDGASVYHGIVREKQSGSTNWTTIEDFSTGTGSPNQVHFNALAVDNAGNIYVGGWGTYNATNLHWIVLERPAGGSTFSVVDSVNTTPTTFNSEVYGLAIDGAGNVFAVGNTAVTTTVKGRTTTQVYWTVREQAGGQGAFSTADNYQFSTSGAAGTPRSVTAITSGPSAGIYAAGYGGSDWLVRKSIDGGATWSLVDNFQYAPTSTANAFAVTGDTAGNVYVVGNGNSATSAHWLVRESSNGGTSWSIVDDFQLRAGVAATAEGVGSDLAGNVYVVGAAGDGSAGHSIIRTNAGGGWATVDDYQLAAGKTAVSDGFTVDPGGNLYAGGQAADSSSSLHWIVRCAAGPTGPSQASAAAAAAVCSSTQISGTSNSTDIFHHRKHRR